MFIDRRKIEIVKIWTFWEKTGHSDRVTRACMTDYRPDGTRGCMTEYRPGGTRACMTEYRPGETRACMTEYRPGAEFASMIRSARKVMAEFLPSSRPAEGDALIIANLAPPPGRIRRQYSIWCPAGDSVSPRNVATISRSATIDRLSIRSQTRRWAFVRSDRANRARRAP